MRARTIGKAVALSGTGFSGRGRATVRLAPGEPGSGITVNGIAAELRHASVAKHLVCLGKGRRRVRGVEHLLAACAGAGVVALEATVEGNELPVLDGSSLPYYRAFERAGLVSLGTVRAVVPPVPMLVERDGGFIAAFPSDRLRVNCLTRFPEFGVNYLSVTVTPRTFMAELAPARTVMRTRRTPEEVRRIYRLRFGLARKGSYVLPERSRLAGEVCRHKMLDLLGDLALLGGPLRAEVFACCPGHRLNLAFVKKLESVTEAA